MITNEEKLPTGVRHILHLMSDPDKLYIVCYIRIGDLLIQGGLASEAVKKFGKTSAVLIVQERFRSFDVAFDSVSEIKYVPFEYLRAYIRCLKTGKWNQLYSGDNFIWAHLHFNAQGKMIGVPASANLLEVFKRGAFGLSIDAPFNTPLIGDIDDARKNELHKIFTLDKERTIILAPHSTSYRTLGGDFWKKIIDRLNQAGFLVYTNVGKKDNGVEEKPFEGTLPMNVSLNEIFYLADKVRCVIGFRSGLLDLLVFSKATIFCITNRSFYSGLKLMFPNTNSTVRTLFFREKLVQKNILNMWHFDAKDYFRSEDTLIDSLIESVEKLGEDKT